MPKTARRLLPSLPEANNFTLKTGKPKFMWVWKKDAFTTHIFHYFPSYIHSCLPTIHFQNDSFSMLHGSCPFTLLKPLMFLSSPWIKAKALYGPSKACEIWNSSPLGHHLVCLTSYHQRLWSSFCNLISYTHTCLWTMAFALCLPKCLSPWSSYICLFRDFHTLKCHFLREFSENYV